MLEDSGEANSSCDSSLPAMNPNSHLEAALIVYDMYVTKFSCVFTE